MHFIENTRAAYWSGGGIGSKKYGVLMFTRGYSGIDTHRDQIYSDEVLLLFIRRSCTEFEVQE